MVVPERVLVDVRLKVLRAHGMIHPRDPPLQDGPEPFNRVDRDVPGNVHLLGMRDAAPP